MNKSYSDCVNEISNDELYKGLLAHGLFSEKLPPIFTSKPFFDYCQTQNPTFPKKPFSYIYYESMRNINIPRPLGIPNPAAYQRLCRHLADQWIVIKQHFEDQTSGQDYKISRIHIRKLGGHNRMFEMSYKNYRTDDMPEPEMLIGNRYMVCADISNCFPSIYSHALSWALVGKDFAKQTQNDKTAWYNVLDFNTRNIKDGETHGLIIGPHTSNLLSEIILTMIDKYLYDAGYRFIRNIDDYTCYVPTYEKAQSFLVELGAHLRSYDLTINHKKTLIAELPVASIDRWVRKINAFPMLNHPNEMNFREVRAYLDFAVELMQESQSNSAVLNYAIKVLAKKQLTTNAKAYCQKTIFHLALLYPYLIPLLDDYLFVPFTVESDRIHNLSNIIYNDGILSQNFEAVCFAVYFALKYNFKLDCVSIDDVKQSEHCIFALLAYLHCKKYDSIHNQKDYKDYAEQLASNVDNFNKNWLFVYETLPQSKLKEYWKLMKSNGVSFVSDDNIHR